MREPYKLKKEEAVHSVIFLKERLCDSIESVDQRQKVIDLMEKVRAIVEESMSEV